MASATTTAELAEIIIAAGRSGSRLAIHGGNSKAGIGAPVDAVPLEMRGFAGIIDYDPAELVLTVGAGTPLRDVLEIVAAEGQQLAFEPGDHAALFGNPAAIPTIGGAIAAGIAGPRRLTMGGARDHLLGFTAVSGRGETLIGGAKVVKNVTGYDLPKLLANSWGRLAAMTQVTLKVLPRPRTTLTLIATGLTPATAIAAMARALGSAADVAAAAHDPATSTTALRLEGFEPSVAARAAMLPAILTDHCRVEPLDTAAADALWHGIANVTALADAPILWRVNLPPSTAAAFAAPLIAAGDRTLFDWAGGLVWLATTENPATIHAAAEAAGGHAMLVRAPADTRARVPAFHPRPAAVTALEARVRRAFDPHCVFETGRFGTPPDAD